MRLASVRTNREEKSLMQFIFENCLLQKAEVQSASVPSRRQCVFKKVLRKGDGLGVWSNQDSLFDSQV